MGIVFWDSACVTPPHRTLWLQQGGWRKLQSSVLSGTGDAGGKRMKQRISDARSR